MSDLGWRAQSSQLARQAKPVEGLREDFGVRLKAAVEAMKEQRDSEGPQEVVRKRKLNLDDPTGKLIVSSNKGVEARAAKDLLELETHELIEERRIAALERKAALYDRLQKLVDLDNEAANDLHEVDFIGKALNQHDLPVHSPAEMELPPPPSVADPEEILRRQQVIKEQMQGGRTSEYSTYDEDVAELEARHQRVDELNALNAERDAEFKEARNRSAARQAAKDKDLANHKNTLLQQLLKKRQKLKS